MNSTSTRSQELDLQLLTYSSHNSSLISSIRTELDSIVRLESEARQLRERRDEAQMKANRESSERAAAVAASLRAQQSTMMPNSRGTEKRTKGSKVRARAASTEKNEAGGGARTNVEYGEEEGEEGKFSPGVIQRDMLASTNSNVSVFYNSSSMFSDDSVFIDPVTGEPQSPAPDASDDEESDFFASDGPLPPPPSNEGSRRRNNVPGTKPQSRGRTGMQEGQVAAPPLPNPDERKKTVLDDEVIEACTTGVSAVVVMVRKSRRENAENSTAYVASARTHGLGAGGGNSWRQQSVRADLEATTKGGPPAGSPTVPKKLGINKLKNAVGDLKNQGTLKAAPPAKAKSGWSSIFG